MVPLSVNDPPTTAPNVIEDMEGKVIDVSSATLERDPFDACLPLVEESASANRFEEVDVQIDPLPVAPYSSTEAVLIRATGWESDCR
jgi:hypothetical protein